MAETHTTNVVHSVPIDATGDVAVVRMSGYHAPRGMVTRIHIAGDETADYAIDAGAPRNDDRSTIEWFEVATETGVTDAQLEWEHPEPYLRVRVTSAAATAGSEADLLVAGGE